MTTAGISERAVSMGAASCQLPLPAATVSVADGAAVVAGVSAIGVAGRVAAVVAVGGAASVAGKVADSVVAVGGAAGGRDSAAVVAAGVGVACPSQAVSNKKMARTIPTNGRFCPNFSMCFLINH
jgi:hypothetical protein